MRVGHAEREAVAAELREHYASGRLTLDELNERLDAALAATTRGDLDALMTDLPSARPFTAGTAGGQGPGRGTGPGARTASGWSAGAGPGPGAGRAGQAAGVAAWAALMMSALLTIGFLGIFGVGVGKPFGIVLIVAGLAFLRRLLFRRRHFRARGPRHRW